MPGPYARGACVSLRWSEIATTQREAKMATKPIPEGYHSVSPYLSVDDAERAIDYYTKAFGAKERARMSGPDGQIAHAELEIGDSVLMLADDFPQFATRPPKELGGTSVSIMLYVEDVDAVAQRAADEGGTITTEVADQFWGDRFGVVTDPFGHVWTIATRVEDVPPEEIAERAKAAMAAMSG
jgi:PhnB protein